MLLTLLQLLLNYVQKNNPNIASDIFNPLFIDFLDDIKNKSKGSVQNQSLFNSLNRITNKN